VRTTRHDPSLRIGQRPQTNVRRRPHAGSTGNPDFLVLSNDSVERVWLHTCTLDGPHALTNYHARGFVPYKPTREVQRLHPGRVQPSEPV